MTPSSSTTTLVARLVFKKSTARKHVFEEIGDPATHVVGSVYIPKDACTKLGLQGKKGEKATVLIEAGHVA
jgi:hypothetical protein